MQYTVSEEVLRATTKCTHDFSCLTTGKCGNLTQCKVNKRFDKNMLYIENALDKEGVVCPYKVSYGSSRGHICTCPTHYSVYYQNECYSAR
jgi:hypothetical protein